MSNSPQNNVNTSSNAPHRPANYIPPHQSSHQPPQIALGFQIPAPRPALPNAEELAAFGKIDASFPERLLAMTEQNAETERTAKLQAQKLQWRESIISRLLGFTFSVGALLTILLLAWWGAYSVAIAVAAAIGITTSAIVWRERSKK
ncbi:hypothetical protein [Acetobacter pasteurianus]|uniref:hypothetical protein n=1 Tax=Acetobacter pasteurianus TaxID=438 RepID=UPI001364347E|nr:hypothetical protein [Acetobacter pasteurianus]QHM91978.1 hypothetical protein FCN51_10700 [Acetobacter pasteurianus]